MGDGVIFSSLVRKRGKEGGRKGGREREREREREILNFLF